MTVPREPPYPPPPREAPADLGRALRGPTGPRLLGLFAHLIGIGLFAAAPLAALAAAYLILQATGWFLVVRVLGFIVCLTFAIVYLKSLMPRRLPAPTAILTLQPDDQPTAHAFLARTASDVGSRPPRRLLLESGVEARLGDRRSLLDLVRDRATDFHVGLWLWQGMTLSEFQALVARTLAPLGRGRFERLRFTSRSLLEALVDGVDSLDEFGLRSHSAPARLARYARVVHALAVAPFRVAGRLLLLVGPRDEVAFADDLAAVRVAGSDALVHAVLRADFAGATFQEMDEAFRLAARSGVFSDDLYAHAADAATMLREAHNDFTLGEPPFLRGPNAGKHADVFEGGQRYLSAVWRGLPPPSAREHSAKRAFVSAERDDRPAAELLDEPARLRARLTALWYRERLGINEEFVALPAGTVRRWIETRGDDTLPAKYAGCYDGGRRIEPGPASERESAVAAATWDDARLLSMAAGLYTQTGDRASRLRAARAALDRLLRRTMYRPTGRERAFAEDLEEDLRKGSRWLAALDRWVYVVHVHMAARLPDLARHDELIRRYESVLRFQPFATDACEYRNRVSAFVHRLDDYAGMPPYRLARDAGREFDSSRKDLAALLADAETLNDPFLLECTGSVRLDRFLYAHEERPFRGDLSEYLFGARLREAWSEVAAKSLWLHREGVAALLDLQEHIFDEFKAVAGAHVAANPPEPPPILDAILLDAEPIPEGPELVEEPDPLPPEDPPDAWLVK